MVFPIIGQWFIESWIFFLGYGFLFSHPDWFTLVLNFEFLMDFFNFLSLLFLGLFFSLILDFNFFPFFLFWFFFIITDFFFGGLFNLQLDFEIDEFWVLLDQIFDLLFFQEFQIVWLHLQDDFRSSNQSGFCFWGNCECSSSGGFPSVDDFFVTGLRNNGNFVGNQISRVKTNTKLSNHRNISSWL